MGSKNTKKQGIIVGLGAFFLVYVLGIGPVIWIDENLVSLNNDLLEIVYFPLKVMCEFEPFDDCFDAYISLWYKRRRHSCGGAAPAGLKTYNGMMATFKKSNYQGIGNSYPVGYDPTVPNSGKYCALYYEVNNAGERITLIGVADANADCRADGDTAADEDVGSYIPVVKTTGSASYLAPVTWTGASKAGYWFGMMKYYHDGSTRIPYDRKFSKDHYAMVAFPDDYGSSGQTTFIINEEGTVYSKDLGKGEYIDTFPGPDPVAHGWEIAQ